MERKPIPLSAFLPGLALDAVGVVLVIAGVLLGRPWLLWSGVLLALVAGGLIFVAIRNHRSGSG